MKVLIAILCCHARIDRAAAQKQTWIKDIVGADYKIFYGRGSHGELKTDEVQLDVPDDYGSLFLKTKAIVRWALFQGYDYIFKCDDDVYVNPVRLLNSGFEKHNYVGEVRPANGLEIKMVSGGGYWLSRDTMLKLEVTSPDHPYLTYHPRKSDGHYNFQQEDVWVANILHLRGVRPHHDNRYGSKKSVSKSIAIATWEYSPEEMIRKHEST